ncbi:MAG: tetratricopeptide repeat protein [Caulobacterales bacterium]|nr:tetratricopeptide repeat protein [Caulobacterales bacterium]
MIAIPRYLRAEAIIAWADRRFGRFGAAKLAAAVASVVVVIITLMPHTRVGEGREGPAELARSLMQQGEYSRAADMLRAAYRARPSESLRMELARALLSSGDYEGALETLRADSLDSETSLARDYMRAEALIRMQRFDDAAELTSTMPAAERLNGRTLLILARAAYGLGDFDRAGALIGEALRTGGDALGEAWLLRARLAFDNNDLDAAKSALARAEEAEASPRSVAMLRIEVLIRAGDFSGAEAAISAMRQPKKRGKRQLDPYAETSLAMLDAAKGDYVSAVRRIRPLEQWLEAEPNGPLLIATIRDGAGDFAQAERRLRVMRAKAPDNEVILAAYGDRLIAEGRLEAAGQLAAGAGDGVRARLLCLSFALASRDFASAIEIAKGMASTRLPPTPGEVVLGPYSRAAVRDRAQYQRVRSLINGARTLSSGNGADAADAARVLAAAGRDPASMTIAGELFLAAREDSAADAAFTKALEEAPALQAAIQGRVRVAVRAWDLASAQDLLEAALRQDADNFPIRVLLAHTYVAAGRNNDAAEVLENQERRLVADPNSAELYGVALSRSGELESLALLAEKMRRARPADPVTAKLLSWAGRDEWAAVSARAALVAAPSAPERVEAFRSAMAKIGKADEAEAFLQSVRPPAGENNGSADNRKEGGGESLKSLRFAYLANPKDAVAASRFGTALSRAGDVMEGIRVMREAAFWAVISAIPADLEIRT